MLVLMLVLGDREFPSYVIPHDASYMQWLAAAHAFDLENPELADNQEVGWKSFDTAKRPGLVPFTFDEDYDDDE